MIDIILLEFCGLHRIEIEDCLLRNANFDAKRIFIDVMDNERVDIIGQIVTGVFFPVNENGTTSYLYTFRFY